MKETRVERRERERREEAQRRRRYQDDDAQKRSRYQDDDAQRRRRIQEIERELELEEERERSQKRAQKQKKRKVGGIITLVILVLIAFTALRVWMESRPGAVDPVVIAGSNEFADSNRINILFLGTNQGLSDTIMVFSLDMEKHRLDQISIPRDTYYPRSKFPGAAYQKVNSVYSTEGLKGASKAAGEILGGIPIHYYAEVDTKGAIKIIDAMGGVYMNVPIDMHYSDPDQNLYIDLKAGYQLLSGEQALQFLRFRSAYPDADLGRIRAQQEFLKAMLAQGGGLNFLYVAMTAQREVTTNMRLTSALALVSQASGMSDWTFNTHTLPGSTGMQNGLSYFFHDAAATKELMRQIYAS